MAFSRQIFSQNSSIVDVWMGSKYTSEIHIKIELFILGIFWMRMSRRRCKFFVGWLIFSISLFLVLIESQFNYSNILYKICNTTFLVFEIIILSARSACVSEVLYLITVSWMFMKQADVFEFEESEFQESDGKFMVGMMP